MEPGWSREAVERILRRAASMSPDFDDQSGISDDALIAAGEEVGISPALLREAIAVERLGPPIRVRAVDRLAGTAVVVLDVRVPASAAEALRRLDAWLVEGHCLRRERLDATGGEWRRRAGIIAAVARAARHASGEGQLGELRINAVARNLADGSMLRVAADRRGRRAGWLGGGASVGAVGVGGAIAGAVLLTPIALVAAPVALVAAAGIARGGRSEAERYERELRRLLDSVMVDQPPTRLAATLTGWIRRR